jgi:hypothetical protein
MGLLYLLLAWYGFGGMITSDTYWTFPGSIVSVAKIIDELLILILLGKIVLNFRTHSKYIPAFVKLFCVIIIFTVFISSIINQVSPIVMLEFLFRYGKGLIIFIYVQMFLKINKKYLENIFNYLRGFVVLQFIVNGLWVLNITIIPNRMLFDRADWAEGTLGSVLPVGLFTSIVLSGSVFSLLMKKGFSKARILELIFFVICIIQLIWVDVKHLYFFIPAIILLQLFSISNRIIRTKMIIYSVLILFAVLPYYRTLIRYYNDNYTRGKNLMLVSPKGLAYYNSFVTIPNEVPVGLIGAGPGKAGSFIGKEDESYLTEKYFSRYDIPFLRVGNSITTMPYTGINTIQSELGYFGTGIFIIMIILVVRKLWRSNKINVNTRKFSTIYQSDFISYFCILFFVFENIMTDQLQSSFIPILIWLIISISYLKYTPPSQPKLNSI